MSKAPRAAWVRRNWGRDDSQCHILHVDMDSFFASVEVLRNPQLKGKPLIVGGKSARGVVTSATYDVRARGVYAGMPMARALRLAPDASVVQSTRGVYSQFSRRVMAILDQITPQVERISIDEAFLDVRGATRRLGSPTQIGTLIRQRIREEVGLVASVGIAPVKSVAKIASSHAKPDGLLLIPAAAVVPFLHALPVGALWGVGSSTGERLKTAGVDTVSDLAHYPLSKLDRLLGVAHARRLHDLAWGVDPRAVTQRAREKSIGTETTFSTNVTDLDALLRMLLRQSHECARRLRAVNLVGWTVSIKVRSADFKTATRSVTLHAPTDSAREITHAAERLLVNYGVPKGGARLLGLRVENLQDRAMGVAQTFDYDERTLEAERAMDAIAQRFGEAALQPASLLGEAHEEEGRE
ncbi:DNA polymerase IV [Gleimia hominis]|uniref:DNA polymerase IV n=1 Tax=Gleimia hominis TaxID=595468 RepID=UPI000C801DFF|nr:DNA polymerase IV [Gleimia hominis]WIK64965.1 DNA polymerase IV [Gleimia hominis]